jgi:NADPH:quinone reductase-like Zn-dependent oxidoreductase
VVVFYPWHSLFGKTVSVLRTHTVDGSLQFVVELPDGTLTHVPAWVTDAQAASASLVDAPVCSATSLAQLARVIAFAQNRMIRYCVHAKGNLLVHKDQ